MASVGDGDAFGFGSTVNSESHESSEEQMEVDLVLEADDGDDLKLTTSDTAQETVETPQNEAVAALEDGECTSMSNSENDMDFEQETFADSESSPIIGKRTSKNLKLTIDAAESSSQNESNTRAPDAELIQIRQYANPFLSDEGKKRAERARRFHDSPIRFNPVAVDKALTASDAEILALYKCCGLFNDEWGALSFDKVGSQYRLDSILIRGINNMSTDDIFAYLYEMGLVPKCMEWVNDACCVVIYQGKVEAAASLLQVTKPISINPDLLEKKKALLIEDKSSNETAGADESSAAEDHASKKVLDYDALDVIPYEKVAVPMPLGYVWRYAKPCDKATGILMRFATVQDKKQGRAEKHSEYYKKHGNPNKPSFSDRGARSRRNVKRSRSNPAAEEPSSSDEENELEPKKFKIWSKLSADWHNEEGNSSQRRAATPRAHTPMPSRNVVLAATANSLPFRDEYYRKRRISSSSKHGRHVSLFNKMHHEEFDNFNERGRQDDLRLYTPGHDSDDEWTERLKGPTMRMHADKEESRIKLQATKTRIQPSISSRLGERSVEPEYQTFPEDDRRRLSVKERLGVRPQYYHENGDELDPNGEDDEIQKLLHDD